MDEKFSVKYGGVMVCTEFFWVKTQYADWVRMTG